MQPEPTLTEILEHESFVRALAAQLVRDAHAVDDLVQETWRIAVERPPRERRNLRGWLRRVVESVAFRQARRRAHLRETELVTEPTTAAAAARSERAADVGRAVLQLDEPYRSVILMRFYDGHPPSRIARQLDRPVNTVNSQLQRALRQLAARLDTSDRRAIFVVPAWLRAIAAWRPALLLRAFVVLTFVGGAVFAVERFGSYVSRPVRPVDTSSATASTVASAPAVVDVPSGRRSVRAVEADAIGSVVVRVVDDRDQPVSDALIFVGPAPATDGVADEAQARARTDEQGEARLALRATDRLVEEIVADEPVVTIHAAAAGWAVSPRVHLLDVRDGGVVTIPLRSGARELTGRVFDPTGRPVSDALVELGDWRPAVESLDLGLRSTAPWVGTRTDAEGRFRLAGVDPSATLVLVRASGFPMRSFRLAPNDRSVGARIERDVQLETGASLVGVVRTADGRPVPNAWVQVETPSEIPRSMHSDETGAFRFAGLSPGPVRAQVYCALDELVADESLTLECGAETTWAPSLQPSFTYRLRPVGADGELVTSPITLTAAGPAGPWSSAPRPLEDGVLEFTGVPSPSASLVVHESRRALFRGAGPVHVIDVEASPDVRSVLVRSDPPGSLSGTLLTATGEVDSSAVILFGAGDRGEPAAQMPVDSKTGVFELALAPRTYELAVFTSLGYASLGAFDVRSGAETDVGVLRLPRPESIDWPWDGDPSCKHRIWCHAPAYKALVGDELVPISNGVGEPSRRELLPGRYRIAIDCADGSSEMRWVTVGDVGDVSALEAR